MLEDDILKNRFENYSPEPRQVVWDRIEAQLDDKPKRRIYLWWWSAALVLAFGLGIFYFVIFSVNQGFDNEVINLESSKVKVEYENNQFGVVDEVLNNPNLNETINQRRSDKLQFTGAFFTSAGLQTRLQKSTQSIFNFPNSSLNNSKLVTDFELNKPVSLMNVNSLLSESEVVDFEEILDDKSTKSDSVFKVSCSNFPITKELDYKKPKRFALTLHVGNYRTTTDLAPNNFVFAPVAEYNLGLANNTFEALQISESLTYRHVMQSIGVDFAFRLSPRWQLRSGLSLLKYKTVFVNENAHFQGANYYQLALGTDFKLLEYKGLSWRIGTGLGSGLLRNPTNTGIESSLRTEWNVNTSLNYKISESFALRFQPTSRLIISDTQVGGFGKLSKWYHGANIGLTYWF